MPIGAESNIGPEGGVYAVERVLAAEAESESKQDDTSSSSGDPVDVLRELLTDAPNMRSRDVVRMMKAGGYSAKAVRSAREKLGVVVKREGFGKNMRSSWSLPGLLGSAHSCPAPITRSDQLDWTDVTPLGTNGADEEVI